MKNRTKLIIAGLGTLAMFSLSFGLLKFITASDVGQLLKFISYIIVFYACVTVGFTISGFVQEMRYSSQKTENIPWYKVEKLQYGVHILYFVLFFSLYYLDHPFTLSQTMTFMTLAIVLFTLNFIKTE